MSVWRFFRQAKKTRSKFQKMKKVLKKSQTMDPLWLLYTDAAGAPAASMSSVSSRVLWILHQRRQFGGVGRIDRRCLHHYTESLEDAASPLKIASFKRSSFHLLFDDGDRPWKTCRSRPTIPFANFSKSACSWSNELRQRPSKVCLRCRGTAHEIKKSKNLKRLTWSSKQRVPDHSKYAKYAPSSELFVHSVKASTPSKFKNLRLKVCQELNHLVHWGFAEVCAAKGWQRQSGETESRMSKIARERHNQKC